MKNKIFNEKELKILKVLIKYGPQKPTAISKLSKLPRPSVYDYLGKLSRRGMVISTVSKGSKTYKVCSRLDLELMIEDEINNNINKLSTLKKVMGSLYDIDKIDYSSEIITYEAIDDIKFQYLKLLDDTSLIKTFVNLHSIDDRLISFFKTDYLEKKFENEVYSRVLISKESEDTELVKLYEKKYLRSEKVFKSNVPFYFFVNIVDDYVLVLLPSLTLLKIKNRHIVNFLEELHDRLWEDL